MASELWVLEIQDDGDDIRYMKAEGRYLAFENESAAQEVIDVYEAAYPDAARKKSYYPVQLFLDDEEFTLARMGYRLPKPKAPKAKSFSTSEDKVCPRCEGEGILLEFKHVDGGRCFACQGTGKKLSAPERNEIIRHREAEEASSSVLAETVSKNEITRRREQAAMRKANRQGSRNTTLYVLLGILLVILLVIRN